MENLIIGIPLIAFIVWLYTPFKCPKCGSRSNIEDFEVDTLGWTYNERTVCCDCGNEF